MNFLLLLGDIFFRYDFFLSIKRFQNDKTLDDENIFYNLLFFHLEKFWQSQNLCKKVKPKKQHESYSHTGDLDR